MIIKPNGQRARIYALGPDEINELFDANEEFTTFAEFDNGSDGVTEQSANSNFDVDVEDDQEDNSMNSGSDDSSATVGTTESAVMSLEDTLAFMNSFEFEDFSSLYLANQSAVAASSVAGRTLLAPGFALYLDSQIEQFQPAQQLPAAQQDESQHLSTMKM